MSVLDRDDFTSSLFFPRRDTTPAPPGARDLMVDGVHVRIHPTAGEHTLLLFHGNGEVVADYDAAAADYARAGVTLAVADYRGYGASEGEPSLRSIIYDARPLAEAVQPTIVMGRSLGGAAAHELYALPVPGMRAVVLESAFSDLRGLIRRRGITPPEQFTAEELETFDPCTKLAQGALPLLALHGEEDTLIVPSEARAALAAAAGATRKKLVLVPGCGHNDLAASPVYWDALAAFVSTL